MGGGQIQEPMYRVSVTRPNSNGETTSQCWLAQNNTEKMEIPHPKRKGERKRDEETEEDQTWNQEEKQETILKTQ